MERPPRHLQPDDRVLMVRLGALGDVLRTLPALHLLRKAFPGLHLAWIVEPLSSAMLVDHPDIDEVITFPRARFRAAARSPLRLAGAVRELTAELRGGRFSVAIDAQGSFKSGLITRLSGAPRRVGFAPGLCRELSFLFTNEWVRLPVPWLNRVDRNLHLTAALGATGDEIDMRLPEGPEEARQADALLARLSPQGRPVVLISPGTSRRQSYKMWPPTSYARVASRLERTLGLVPVVSWGPGEENLAAAVVDGSNGSALMAPSIGLRLLAGLLRRSALFIGADTGPMHLAWGVGCPVVAVFGPTDPRLNAPLGRDDVVLRSSDSTETVTADQVLAAAGRVLARRKDHGATRRSPRLSRAALFSPGRGSIA